ncbi:hypothetical protein GRI72_02805 [Altererythrobacter marinus]|uniref:Uncharacterized protein n=1 Tax=Pelagerythrobacter marinus TaxID=538382 RepID=A0ABW9UYJ6_9SPHN|nr:hypothetical protein [Pelagerythrobacter marinus]MXO67762.1 hypothetical protein [Pelagerythrobacter marinus]
MTRSSNKAARELLAELEALLRAQKQHCDWTHDKAVAGFMETNGDRILSALRATHSPSEAEVEPLDEWGDCGNLGWCGMGDKSYCTRHNREGWVAAKRALSLPSDKTVELLRERDTLRKLLVEYGDRVRMASAAEHQEIIDAAFDSHLGEMK